MFLFCFLDEKTCINVRSKLFGPLSLEQVEHIRASSVRCHLEYDLRLVRPHQLIAKSTENLK